MESIEELRESMELLKLIATIKLVIAKAMEAIIKTYIRYIINLVNVFFLNHLAILIPIQH